MEDRSPLPPWHVIYHFASTTDRFVTIYKRGDLPQMKEHYYENIRKLVDIEQGGFERVELRSLHKDCMKWIYGKGHPSDTNPSVVLIEVPSDHRRALDYLRLISAQKADGAFKQPLVCFALSTAASNPSDSVSAHDELKRSCTGAGATDLLRSPLSLTDVDAIAWQSHAQSGPSAHLLGSCMVPGLTKTIISPADDMFPMPKPKLEDRHLEHLPLPDLIIPQLRMDEIKGAIASWHFQAHELDNDELTYAVVCMLEHALDMPELESARIPREQIVGFLIATRRQYRRQREVHYHNWRHAVDVTQSIFCFLLELGVITPIAEAGSTSQDERSPFPQLMQPLDGLALIISTIGHDVGHPGVNNAFLVACEHPLSQLYNDRSVLENYHCAAYSQLLRRHWPKLGTIGGFRTIMICNILATDMQRHFEYMSSLSDLSESLKSSGDALKDWPATKQEHAKELVMALLMKAADISNVARPFDISAKWAKVLMAEFSRQGELEQELQMPTCLFGGPPLQGDFLAEAQSQIGFIDLFGFPLFKGIAEILPKMQFTVTEIEQNKDVWVGKVEGEKARLEIPSAKPSPYSSGVTKTKMEKTERHRSEPTAMPIPLTQTPSSPTRRVLAIGQEEPTPPVLNEMSKEADHTSLGFSTPEKRSSMPFLPAPGNMTFPYNSHGGASRRSSKDVALDQLQAALSSNSMQQNNSPGSRRGSADASFHINQSFPGSRRGSKDESLTTILVTSQGSPGRRPSPSSSGKGTATKTSKPSPTKRHQPPHSGHQQQSSAARASFPSSRSHATSSATAGTTAQSQSQSQSQSPSTQPSSLADSEGGSTPPAHHMSIPSTEDPFLVPGSFPTGYDGSPRASAPAGLITPPPHELSSKPSSPRIIARMASADFEDGSARPAPRKGENGIRESRSRSRLRGLKFWKKKKDASVEGSEGSL